MAAVWNFTDEAAIKDAIAQTVAPFDNSARTIVYTRAVIPNTATLETVFLVMGKVNNSALIKQLMKTFLPMKADISFTGSEINLEGGNLEIDYLKITAKIKPKLN